MANIQKIKIGADNPDAILFDKYHEDMSNLKFDFTEWTINEAANNDITVEQGRITIRKFRPNRWIIKSPVISGIANTAVCAALKNIVMSSSNISKNAAVFGDEQQFKNSAGAGNDLPKFRGFCPYPMTGDGVPVQASDSYNWEACWSGPDIRDLNGFNDYGAFRLGAGGHGTFGIWSDFTNKTMFPNELYDFPTWTRNYNGGGNSVNWYYGFILATGLVNDFDDGTWELDNDAVLDGRKVKITTRIAANTNGWHVGKNAAPKACKVKVTGLSEGDTVYYGANVVTNNNVVLCTTDGTYDIPAQSNGGTWGFGFRIVGSGTSEVTIEFVNELTDDNGLVDISDNPIVITLFNSNGVDITSVECWDAYAETEQVWHKDKTVENCLMKYRLMIPNNYELFSTFFGSNNNITWITPTKFRINRIPAEGLNINGAFTTFDGNYTTVTSPALSIRLAGLPSNSTAKFIRTFKNTNAADDIETTLTNNNVTQIPAVNKIVYKAEEAENILYCAGNIVITGECNGCNAIVEFIPQYTSDGYLTINTDIWSTFVSNIIVPQVTDLLNYITRTKFAMKPANPEIWNEIKTWYENNVGSNTNFRNGNVFKNSAGLKEITIKMEELGFQFGEDNFMESEIETINFIQPVKTAHFSSPQRLLRSARNLKNINITWAEPDADDNYLCGADSIADGMSGLTCETYPERFINWEQNRSNIHEGIHCTLFQYCFNYSSGLVTIPAFPGEREEANTILPANFLENSFRNCTSLVTVGPILNLILCAPNSAKNVFQNCDKLASIKIKNLNHGSWNFDNETRDGNYHGTLKALNQESVQYLFANLVDLTTHNSEVHEDTIDKSFKNWSSDYKESISQTPDWDYTLTNIFTFACRRRYANANSAVLIVSTNQALENMQINISGLQEGDSIVFGANNAEPIVTFDTDGNHTVTKESGTSMGFKLVSANTEDRTEVQIAIVNGLDNTNPRVSAANLYCPTEWDSYITPQMITAANAKGWTIYVGGTVKNA